MKQRILSLMVLPAVLAGCSGDPETTTAEFIQQKDYKSAIAWLNEELVDEPEDLLLNALMAEVNIQDCIATNCVETNPAQLKTIKRHLLRVPMERVPTEQGFRFFRKNIEDYAKATVGTDFYPAGLVELTKNVPEGELQDNLITMMFEQANTHIVAHNVPAAMSLFEGIIALKDKKNMLHGFSNLMIAMVGADETMIKQALEDLKLVGEVQAPEEVLTALPYLFYHQSVDTNTVEGTSKFLDELPEKFKDWIDTPLQSKTSRQSMAAAVYGMAQNPEFLAKSAKHIRWGTVEEKAQTTEMLQAETPEIETEAVIGESPIIEETKSIHADTTEMLKLKLLRTAIMLHPQNETYWEEFLDPAIAYVERTGDASLLFSGASAALIPNETVEKYNRSIFIMIQAFIEKERNILPLVSKVIVPLEKGDLVREQAGNMVKIAMDKALEKGNYELIYVYSTEQPEVARLSRQKIVTVTIEALENKWKDNDFEGLDELSSFLTDKMEIDFSLDSLLLQSFDDHLKEQKLAERLSSDNIDSLLVPAEEAYILPDEKLTFLRQHFEKSPEVIDNVLKSYIVKAEGQYGTANALYRMFNLFDDKNFPETERRSYLVNSIKTALSKDETLTTKQVADLGYKLHGFHDYVPLIFVAGEVVKRIENLEQARDVWQNSSQDLRQSIKTGHPQYATLMQAVEAYENDDREDAAKLFTIITSEKYKTMALPYIEEYIAQLAELKGIYAAKKHSNDMSTLLLEVTPVATVDNLSPNNQLLDIDIKFISGIGLTLIKSPQDLSEDYSKVFTHVIRGHFDPTMAEIIIPEEERAAANLAQSFDKIFGKITSLRFLKNRIVMTSGPQFYNMELVSDMPSKAMFPKGKFGITEVVREEDANTSQILPLGTIIELQTQETKPIQPVKAGKKLSVIYPVKGIIRNPAMAEVKQIEGYYSPERHTTSLSYDYPLIEGGNINAALRCQIFGTFIQCAAHNKMSNRNRYSYLVTGQKIEGNKQSKELQNLEKRQGKGFNEAKRKAYLERQKRMQNGQ